MKMIVAADKNWGIGKNNGLLAHLPGDLKYFKERTVGKVVVMGRATLESLPGGRPLPERINVVISRQEGYEKEGCLVVRSVEEAAAAARKAAGAEDAVMVIGGASIYQQMLPYCDTCYVTKLNAVFSADKYFPNLDENPDFQLVWESTDREENGIGYKFTEYKRV